MSALQNSISRNGTWFFCPTFYSDWHLRKESNARDYLKTIGEILEPEVHILWTGSTIISRNIDQACLIEITEILNRKPCIWDNFHAVDYLPATALFTGPLSGRDPNIRSYSSGYLLNMSQWSYPSLLAMLASTPFLTCGQESPEEAWSNAIDACFNQNLDAVKLILGYFYSPWSVSSQWKTLIQTLTQTVLTASDPSPLIEQLKEIATRINDDTLIDDDYEFWCDLFPFVQTLRGDIDFTLKFLTSDAQHLIKQDTRMLRDRRWSTPLYHCILSLCTETP